MIFLLELLKQKKKTVNMIIDGTFEKIPDKVTDIMDPLSKLWVMIENANSEKDDNTPVIQMNAVLQLLEKTVVLIGQCSNIITYERHKNALRGVKGTSITQVAAMLKEKASFFQNHGKALFGLLIIQQRLSKPKNSQQRESKRRADQKIDSTFERAPQKAKWGVRGGGGATVPLQRLQTRQQ